MRRFRHGTSSEAGSEINLSPLIDVVFLLLIFFIVTTTLLKEEQDLKLTLPTPGETSPTLKELPVTVNIDEMGPVQVGSGRNLELVEPAGTGLISNALR